MVKLDATSAGASDQDESSRDGVAVAQDDALAEAIDRLMPEDALDDDHDTFVAKGGERQKSPDEELAEQRPTKKAKARPEVEDEDQDEDELEDEEDGDEDDELEGSVERAEDDENEGEEKGAEDDEAALEHAYEVLLRAKRAPFSVLKRTPKATLIAWAESVESEQAEGASASNGHAQRGRETAEAGDQSTDTAAQPKTPSWDAERARLAKAMGVDEETAEAFKPYHDRQEALEKRLNDMDRASVEREGRRNISNELRRLATPYPELKDNQKKRDKVTEAALTLANGLQSRGKTVDVEKVFDQAARMALGPPKRSDLKHLRRQGFATAPYGNRGGLGVERSEVEFWDKAIAFSEQGKPDLIKRMRLPGKATKPVERFLSRKRQ